MFPKALGTPSARTDRQGDASSPRWAVTRLPLVPGVLRGGIPLPNLLDISYERANISGFEVGTDRLLAWCLCCTIRRVGAQRPAG